MSNEGTEETHAVSGYTPTPIRRRAPESIAEVEHLRHSEMQSISDRLARVGDFPWARAWVAFATLSGGALLGGAVALIPFLSVTPKPSGENELIYFVVLGVVALVTVLAVLAAISTHEERAESISVIKADFDTHILGTFEELDE